MAQKPKQTSKTDRLEEVLNDFNHSWDYASSSYHQRWSDAWKLYNNTRVKVGYRGITDTFVPMTFSTIETMVSALFGGKPQFNYTPPSNRQDQDTKILNALVDHYWDKDKWNIKCIGWGRGMLREGTSIIYVYWNIDHPCIINVPIRDFFIDPNASTLENARYMGRRYLTTLDELKTFEVIDFDSPTVDPETGETSYEMKKKYTNLENIESGTSDTGGTDKEVKDMFYGSTITEAEKSQVEVIEHWTKDRVVSVLNRSRIIEDTENYHKKQAEAQGNEYPEGLMPFAALRDYTDESLFYARGEIDIIKDEQELLNDITNQSNDSLMFTLNQMYTLDPKYAHLLEEVENIPGAVYLAAKDAINPIQHGTIPPEAFNERQNIKNEIRETTASNEVIKGVGQEEGHKTTATEINAQIAGAGQRLGLKITQIENEGFHRLAKIVFEMIKLYVTEPMMVRIVGQDGISWEEFDPADFQGDYEPRVQLQTTIENQKNEEAQMAKELMAAFLGDMDVNQQELKKMVLAKGFKLDPDEVELLMTPPELSPEMLDPSMTGEPMMPEDELMEGPGIEGTPEVPDEALAVLEEEGALV